MHTQNAIAFGCALVLQNNTSENFNFSYDTLPENVLPFRVSYNDAALILSLS